MFRDRSAEFDRFIQKCGGTALVSDRATFEALIAPSIFFTGKVIADLPMAIPADMPRPKLEFAFAVFNGLPNGVVGREGDINCCLLYHTYPLCLLEMFCILACDPAFLAHIGDTSREVRRPFLIGSNPIGIQHWSDEFGKANHWTKIAERFSPQSQERTDLAFYMMHVALRFVWFHEIAHVLDGHIDYLMEEKRLPEIYFHLTGRRDQVAGAFEKRALEVFADTIAMKLLLNGIMNVEDSYMPKIINSLTRTELIAVNLLAIAALGWFWGVRDQLVAGDQCEKSSAFVWTGHPSAVSRVVRMARNAKLWMERLGPENKTEFDMAMNRVGEEVEVLAATHPAFQYLKSLKAYEAADWVFTVPFLPPPSAFNAVTARLKKHSLLYRFGGLS
jgi:hypothetical protein